MQTKPIKMLYALRYSNALVGRATDNLEVCTWIWGVTPHSENAGGYVCGGKNPVASLAVLNVKLFSDTVQTASLPG